MLGHLGELPEPPTSSCRTACASYGGRTCSGCMRLRRPDRTRPIIRSRWRSSTSVRRRKDLVFPTVFIAVRRVHPRLRHHARAGHLDALAPGLLARRRHQGRHRAGLLLSGGPLWRSCRRAGPAEPRANWRRPTRRLRSRSMSGPRAEAAVRELNLELEQRVGRAHRRSRGHERPPASGAGREGSVAARGPASGEEQPAGGLEPDVAAGAQGAGGAKPYFQESLERIRRHGPGSRAALPDRGCRLVRRRRADAGICERYRPDLRRPTGTADHLPGRGRTRPVTAAARCRDAAGADRQRGRLQRFQARLPEGSHGEIVVTLDENAQTLSARRDPRRRRRASRRGRPPAGRSSMGLRLIQLLASQIGGQSRLVDRRMARCSRCPARRLTAGAGQDAQQRRGAGIQDRRRHRARARDRDRAGRRTGRTDRRPARARDGPSTAPSHDSVAGWPSSTVTSAASAASGCQQPRRRVTGAASIGASPRRAGRPRSRAAGRRPVCPRATAPAP